MSKQRFKPNAQTRIAQSAEQEVAREFARISKLNSEGKYEQAWDAANDLHAKHPNDPTANFVMALMLSDNDQKDDALEFAEAAVKFGPNAVRNLVFLGRLYVDLGMIEYAPTILHKAFSLDNKVYQAPWSLAVYYLNAGQGIKALPYFDSALDAAPESAKDEIRLNRADCLRDIGRIDEAEAEYNALSAIPRYRVFTVRHAALLRKNDHNSDYASRVRQLLDEPDLSDKDRSLLLLCLGRLHENGRDYDNAFLDFEKSRNLIKTEFASELHFGPMSDCIKTFKRDVFEKFKAFGNPSEKPIFIVGMPRSGTTMTEQIIASHSQVEGVGELDRMARLDLGMARGKGMQGILDKMSEVGPDNWNMVCLQYLNLVNALAPDAMRTVDKMPQNFISLGFIHLCFPNAKIIHCKRNPLDNFISAYQNAMNSSHDYAYDQVAYGKYYIKYLELMNHWKAVFASNIYESQYESLTANPETEVRKMLEFLDLPWEESCLKFNERKSTVRTFSSLQVRSAINTGSVARWRNYEKQLGPIMSVLDDAGVKFDN
jgi:tetratricopeptide (TPR) repeat protein